MGTPQDLMRDFLDGCGGMGPFIPCAMYNKALDTATVYLRDCSATSVRTNDYISVLLANHPEGNGREFVGFEIYGVKCFIKKYLDYDTKHKVSKVLEIMETFHHPRSLPFLGDYEKEIKDALNQFEIQVDIAE